MIRIKRAYDAPDESDGKRILVDRLWPRGVSKERAQIHEWAKDIAPSAELRKWFCHDIEQWPEFQKRYEEELTQNKAALQKILQEARQGTVTLIYGSKDEEHNQAVLLQKFLAGELKS